MWFCFGAYGAGYDCRAKLHRNENMNLWIPVYRRRTITCPRYLEAFYACRRERQRSQARTKDWLEPSETM